MSSVFALLFLLALGLALWGAISPSSMSKFGKKPITRRDAGLSFGIIAFVFFVLTGITAPSKQSAGTDANGTTPSVSEIQSNTDTQSEAKKVTTKTFTETEAIPFESKTVESSAVSKGASTVTTKGINGVKTLTYEVTYEGDKETKKTLIKEEVTTQPVAQVTTIGTKVAAATPKPAASAGNCDPNYSGVCVPIASDVDCAGGSGDGPAYVRGPVRVVGRDIYGLDGKDKDGIGCE